MEKDQKMATVDNPVTTPGQIAFDVEKSFLVAVLPGGLYSVNGNLCMTSTKMVNAVKAECGIVRKPRKKADAPAKKKK